MTGVDLKSAVNRHFAPAEVEAITGVAVATLRDWKRRELIMPEAIRGWRKFPLGTLALIAVLKAASDAGLAINTMASWAPWWAGVVRARILSTPDAQDDVKDRFGVAIANGPHLLTEAVDRALADHGGLSCVVLDLYAIAANIVERAGEREGDAPNPPAAARTLPTTGEDWPDDWS